MSEYENKNKNENLFFQSYLESLPVGFNCSGKRR